MRLRSVSQITSVKIEKLIANRPPLTSTSRALGAATKQTISSIQHSIANPARYLCPIDLSTIFSEQALAFHVASAKLSSQFDDLGSQLFQPRTISAVLKRREFSFQL